MYDEQKENDNDFENEWEDVTTKEIEITNWYEKGYLPLE